MIKEDKTGPPENAVLQYRPVISFRVRKALGSSNPDWEDVVNEILTQAVAKIKSGEFRGDSSIGTYWIMPPTRPASSLASFTRRPWPRMRSNQRAL